MMSRVERRTTTSIHPEGIHPKPRGWDSITLSDDQNSLLSPTETDHSPDQPHLHHHHHSDKQQQHHHHSNPNDPPDKSGAVGFLGSPDRDLESSIPLPDSNDAISSSSSSSLSSSSIDNWRQKQSFSFRMMILTCISFISVGSYFAYDSISALEPYLKKDFSMSTFQFGLLFSVYSLPNTLLLIYSGFLIDQMGTKKAGLYFCGLIVIGTGIHSPKLWWIIYLMIIIYIYDSFLVLHVIAIVASSPVPKSYGMMLFGRFVFG